MRPPDFVGELLQRVEVQDRLLHRHRDEVLHLERQGLLQLTGRHPGKVDLAHDHLLVGHADHDLLGAELRLGPQLLDGCSDGVGVDHLAVAHRARRQGHLAETLERRRALAERELGSAHPRRPDVETYDFACHCSSPPAAARGPRGPTFSPVSERASGRSRDPLSSTPLRLLAQRTVRLR